MVSIGDRQNAVAPLRVEVLSRSFRKSHDSMEEAAASEAANTSLRIGQSSHRARSITQEEERDRKGFLLILPWVKHLLWRFFGWLVSLRVLLPIAIVASIAVTVATVWGFTHNNTNTAINDLSERLRIQISNRISKDLYTLFTLPGVINKVQRGYSNLDQVDSQDLEVLRSIAFTHINIFLSVTHIYFGTTRGDMIGYERQDEDTLMLWKRSNETDDMMYILPVDTGTGKPVGEPLHVLPFNSVERPWYVAAKEAQGATWSEVYLFSDNVLGITASLPVYNAENELMLVTASDRTLVSIVQLLEEAVEEDIRAMRNIF